MSLPQAKLCQPLMIYAMHPATTISIDMLCGLKRQNNGFASGKSILSLTK